MFTEGVVLRNDGRMAESQLAELQNMRVLLEEARGLGGLRRALMGSVSDSVVRHAHCPVLVVGPEEEQAA